MTVTSLALITARKVWQSDSSQCDMPQSRKTLATRLTLILLFVSECPATNADNDAPLEWSTELVANFDLLANLDGGRDQGVEVPSTLDLISDLTWGNQDSNTAHRIKLFVQGTAAGDFSTDRVGDLQVVSSLEAPNTVKLFEAWYQYTLADQHASVLIGLHDFNTEFYVLERASELLHSSFGIGPELSQANASLFPTTALGAVVRFQPRDQLYVTAGIYDGIPGKPTDPYGTHIRFDNDDGIFAVAEVGHLDDTHKIPMKAAIGAWHSTATFEDPTGARRNENSGAYLIAETPIRTFDRDGNIGLFFQFGMAQASRNAISRYVGGGLQWIAPFTGLGNDSLSLGVAHARLSGKQRRALGVRNRAETAIELTYAYRVNRWLMVQPDVQLIVDPGAANDVDDAFVAGLRIVLSLL